MRIPNLSLPKWSLYAIGLAPLAAIFVIIVISVVGGGGGRGGLVTFDDTGEVEVLRETPSDFTLELFSGESLTLSEEIGDRPILVDFWGSWCVPCRREAPVLETVWRQYQDRVLFVGVAVFDTDSRARDFLREFGVTYPSGPDPRGAIAIEYGLTGVPEKHFIDRGGRVVRKFVGPLSEERLSAILDDVLAIQ